MTIQSLGIHIKVSDFAKSNTFYEALGFQKVFEYGPDKTFQKDEKGNLVSAPEKYHGVTFQVGNAKLEIADGHRAVKPEVFKEPIASSKVSLMIYVDSINEIIDKCTSAGIPLVVGPRHYYWGTLEVVVRDPDGFILVFIAPYSEKEANNIRADETFSQPPS
ncbi:VOC family protein [Patescibacteria group bacterium]|nr:VOC family protein [Patescibacteria group bacterium]